MSGAILISIVNESRVGNKQIPTLKQRRPYKHVCAWRLIEQIPVYLWLASRKTPAHTCLRYHTQQTDAVKPGEQETCQKSKTAIRGDNGDNDQDGGWFGKTGNIVLCPECWGGTPVMQMAERERESVVELGKGTKKRKRSNFSLFYKEIAINAAFCS